MKNLVKKYNKSEIMRKAWVIFKSDNNTLSFGDCLRKSWHIAKNGENNETFEEIYNNNKKQIFRYILLKVKDVEIAEDLTQEVFIKLHKNFYRYDVYKAKINTWLHAIANNCIIDHIRSKANKNKMNSISINQSIDENNKEFLQLPDNSTNENDVEINQLSDNLNKAFENLKPKYKQIAEIYFRQELKYNEISEQLNIPMGTVKGMINRCREMLQEQLKNEKV